MKRTAALPIALAMLSACRPGEPENTTPIAAYRQWSDKLRAASPLRNIFPPCLRSEKERGELVQYWEEPDQCFEMDPPQRWRGIWRLQLESSWFCPASTSACLVDEPRVEFMELRSQKDPEERALYAIDFIGRRSKLKAGYGMFGGSEYQIVVDRMLSIEKIGQATFNGPSCLDAKHARLAPNRSCAALNVPNE